MTHISLNFLPDQALKTGSENFRNADFYFLFFLICLFTHSQSQHGSDDFMEDWVTIGFAAVILTTIGVYRNSNLLSLRGADVKKKFGE